MTTSIRTSILSVPSMVEAALRRVRNEQQRAAVLVTGAAKYRRLSTLHEQEARLWTLLVRHTAEPVHRRAATDAQCAARGEGARVRRVRPALARPRRGRRGDDRRRGAHVVTARIRLPLPDRCEICGLPLISRRVRRHGRCGAHPHQPVLPQIPDTSRREGAPR